MNKCWSYLDCPQLSVVECACRVCMREKELERVKVLNDVEVVDIEASKSKDCDDGGPSYPG